MNRSCLLLINNFSSTRGGYCNLLHSHCHPHVEYSRRRPVLCDQWHPIGIKNINTWINDFIYFYYWLHYYSAMQVEYVWVGLMATTRKKQTGTTLWVEWENARGLTSKDRWRHFIKISLRNRLFLNANDIQIENHRSNPMLKGTIEGGRQLFHSFITATVWWQFRSRLTSTTLLYLLAAHDNSYSPISFDGRIITLFRA